MCTPLHPQKSAIRSSNLELLKIIAVILIIFAHTSPYYCDPSAESYIDVDLASTNFQHILLSFFDYFGQIGNCIFIICSSYFLVNSARVKVKKILYIVADSFIISVIFLCGYLIAGYDVPGYIIALQFIPIMARFNWFIGCYLIIYAIHPLLNLIVKNASKRSLLLFNIFIFVLYCIIEFVGGDLINIFYYTHLTGFLCIYFFTAYVKLYLTNFMANTKKQVIILVSSIVGLIGLFALTEFLCNKIEFLSDKVTHWNEISNPFMLGIGFPSFALFSKLNFRSKIINYISSLSLLIYLIHENKMFRLYTKYEIFDWIYFHLSYDHIALYCIVLVVISFIWSILLGAFYKHTIGTLIRKLIDKIYPKLSVKANKIIDSLEAKD